MPPTYDVLLDFSELKSTKQSKLYWERVSEYERAALGLRD